MSGSARESLFDALARSPMATPQSVSDRMLLPATRSDAALAAKRGTVGMCTSRPAARRSNKATADPLPKPMSLPGHGRRPSAADLLPPLSHGTPAVVAASAAPPLSERAGLLRGASASSIKGLEERQPFSSAQLVPPIGQQASFSGNALEILDELRSGRGDGGFEYAVAASAIKGRRSLAHRKPAKRGHGSRFDLVRVEDSFFGPDGPLLSCIDHATISAEGVTFVTFFADGEREMEFLTADEFIRLHKICQHLYGLRFFQEFCQRKTLMGWHRGINQRKFSARCRELAGRNSLLSAHPHFGPALLKTREQHQRMLQTCRFVQLAPNDTVTLDELLLRQKNRCGAVRRQIGQHGQSVRAIISGAVADARKAANQQYLASGSGIASAEESARRVVTAALKRVSRLVQFQACDALRMLLGDAAEQLVREFSRNRAPAPPSALPGRDSRRLYPDDVKADDSSISLPKVPADAPVLYIEACLMDLDSPRLTVIPGVGTLQTALAESLSEMTETVVEGLDLLLTEQPRDIFAASAGETATTLPADDPPRAVTPPLANEPQLKASFRRRLQTDDSINSHLTTLRSLAADIIGAATAALPSWEPLRLLVERANEFYASAPREPPSEEFFRTSLWRFQRELDELSGVVVETDQGRAHLSCFRLRQMQVAPMISRCIALLHDCLPRYLDDKLSTLLEFIDTTTTHLQELPEDLEEVATFLVNLSVAESKEKSMDQLYSLVLKLYDLIKAFRVRQSDKNTAFCSTIVRRYDACSALVSQRAAQRPDITQMLRKRLATAITALLAALKELHNDIYHPSLLSTTTDIVAAQERLGVLEKRLEKIRQRGASCEIFEAELAKGPAAAFVRAADPSSRYMEQIQEASGQIAQRRELWECTQTWSQLTARWSASTLDGVHIAEMQTETTKHLLSCERMDRLLPSNDAVPKLFESIREVQDTLPLLSHLRNADLRERHWAIIGTELPGVEAMTVQEIAAARGPSVERSVATVSQQATAEAVVETTLAKLVASWKEVDLPLVSHGSTRLRSVMILGELDAVYDLLDHSQMTGDMLRVSKHVGPVLANVLAWERQMALAAETLDTWVQCQQMWVSLEPIFATPDIRAQLFTEARLFAIVDKTFKRVMRTTAKRPDALHATTLPGVLEALQLCNCHLERVRRSLDGFLDSRRLTFSRFYFLSNDELLQVLSHSRNPRAIQPFLSKCFAAVAELGYTSYGISQVDISCLKAASGADELPLTQGSIKAQGSVDSWLGKVEAGMQAALRAQVIQAVETVTEENVVASLPLFNAQTILLARRILWGRAVTRCMSVPRTRRKKEMSELDKRWKRHLIHAAERLAARVLTASDRLCLEALLTLEVHLSSVVGSLVAGKVHRTDDFEWQKQLRHTMDGDGNVVVKQCSAAVGYSFEYFGITTRLVVTPLTSRCFLALMMSVQLHLGCALSGPAGTGKTETVKDLAKALGRMCVVFNCTEALDASTIGNILCGAVQSGAWCCLDEFNRVTTDVLSMVGQQLHTIKTSRDMGLSTLVFHGREMRVAPACGVFITMNPDYGHRSELPGTLRSLLRPIALVEPDTPFIAEVILYVSGVVEAKAVAAKLTTLLALASRRLSRQTHYDFGLRAVKSILSRFAAMRRPSGLSAAAAARAVLEAIVASVHSTVTPMLSSRDAVRLASLLDDVFPGVSRPVPPATSGGSLAEVARRLGLQPLPWQMDKARQLQGFLESRVGAIVVGGPGTGKSTIIRLLGEVYADATQGGHDGSDRRRPGQGPRTDAQRPSAPASSEQGDGLAAADGISRRAAASPEANRWEVVNPTSYSLGDLFGQLRFPSGEWVDGIVPRHLRKPLGSAASSQQRSFLVFDGPVAPAWVESMNSLLDNSRTLCLGNGERIRAPQGVSVLFECGDVANASPATISRCGIVYLDAGLLGWEVVLEAALETMFQEADVGKRAVEAQASLAKHTRSVLATLIPLGAGLLQHQPAAVTAPAGAAATLTRSLCQLLRALLHPRHGHQMHRVAGVSAVEPLLTRLCVFAFVWSFGGALSSSDARLEFDSDLSRLLRSDPMFSAVDMPPDEDVFGCYVDSASEVFVRWEGAGGRTELRADHDGTVAVRPVLQTRYLLDVLVAAGVSTRLVGAPACGKSLLARDALRRFHAGLSTSQTEEEFHHHFGLQMTDAKPPEAVRAFLAAASRGTATRSASRAGGSSHALAFVEDLNVAGADADGAFPALEALREVMSTKQVRGRDHKPLTGDVRCLATSTTVGGGGGWHQVPGRLARLFFTLAVAETSAAAKKDMLACILTSQLAQRGHLQAGDNSTPGLVHAVAGACVRLYEDTSGLFRPTPHSVQCKSTPHDLFAIVRGLLMAPLKYFASRESLLRLFVHEASRVLQDRLRGAESQQSFARHLAVAVNTHFKTRHKAEFFWSADQPMFGDFISGTAGRKLYELIDDPKHAATALQTHQTAIDVTRRAGGNVVLFPQAVAHVTRLARALRSPGGHAIVYGRGGVGKKTLLALAAHVCGLTCVVPTRRDEPAEVEFRECVQGVLRHLVVTGKAAVLGLTDAFAGNGVVLGHAEELMRRGWVPGLFGGSKLKEFVGCIRAAYGRHAKSAAASSVMSQSGLIAWFAQRVKHSLRFVLSLSLHGTALRACLMRHPVLTRGCAIMFMDEWPATALRDVGRSLLFGLSLEEDPLPDAPGQLIGRDDLARASVELYDAARLLSAEFQDREGRVTAVTPSTFFGFIELFSSLWAGRRATLAFDWQRLRQGVHRLRETQAVIRDMQAELSELEPELRVRAARAQQLSSRLQRDQENLQRLQAGVHAEAQGLQREADRINGMFRAAQEELQRALPALEEANEAVGRLDKNDIAEIRVYANPPRAVQNVIFAVSVLLHRPDNWDAAKKLLMEGSFLKSLTSFQKNSVTYKVAQRLKRYTQDPAFSPEHVGNISRACKSLCQWVLAVDRYVQVYGEVVPKRERARQLDAQLSKAKAELGEKQEALELVQQAVSTVEAVTREAVGAAEELEDRIETTARRMGRASGLLRDLSDEWSRWQARAEALQASLQAVVGDSFANACFVAYAGPLTPRYRQRLMQAAQAVCQRHGLPTTTGSDVLDQLTTPAQVQGWQRAGLPSDRHSTENAALLAQCHRYPLLVDPEGQAGAWLREAEKFSDLVVTSTRDPLMLSKLRHTVETGGVLLVEGVEADLPPVLTPLLESKLGPGRAAGRTVRIGDAETKVDGNFRLYLSTSHPNPQLLPAVLAVVLVVTFTVTHEALCSHLLRGVVAHERPKLEKTRVAIEATVAGHINDLRDVQEKILQHVSDTSSGGLLDNQELVDTLQVSKQTEQVLSQQLSEAEATRAKLAQARGAYRIVAERAASLYFAVASLPRLDWLYQHSLAWFHSVFVGALAGVPRCYEDEALPRHLGELCETVTAAVFDRATYSLSPEHRLPFAFLLTGSLLRAPSDGGATAASTGEPSGSGAAAETTRPGAGAAAAGDAAGDHAAGGDDTIPEWEWRTFLSPTESHLPGAAEALDGGSQPAEPVDGSGSGPAWPSASQWRACRALEGHAPFRGLVSSLGAGRHLWKAALVDDEWAALSPQWDHLSGFQRLMLVKVLRKDQLSRRMAAFVAARLGPRYAEPGDGTLADLFDHLRPDLPALLVTPPAVDATAKLQTFAKGRGYGSRLHIVPLGHGQRAAAEDAIRRGLNAGDWVLLQNCHLDPDFMHEVARWVHHVRELGRGVIPTFRLWLSSDPDASLSTELVTLCEKFSLAERSSVRACLSQRLVELGGRDIFFSGRSEPSSLPGGGIQRTRSRRSRSSLNLLAGGSVGTSSGSQHGFNLAAASSSDTLGMAVLGGELHVPEEQCGAWRTLLYKLCGLHAVVVGREGYRAVGWSANVRFSSADLRTGALLLRNLLWQQGSGVFPLDQFRQTLLLLGYGGHVTNQADRALLEELVYRFFESGEADEAFDLSGCGMGPYATPTLRLSTTEALEAVQTMPAVDAPQVLRLHASAEGTAARAEGRRHMSLLQRILPLPEAGGPTAGGTARVAALARHITAQLPDGAPAKYGPTFFADVDVHASRAPLVDFLLEEMACVDRLLALVSAGLASLTAAISGETGMGEADQSLYDDLLRANVPSAWLRASLLHHGTVATWTAAVSRRLQYLQTTLARMKASAASPLGAELEFWLPGFMHLRGFLAAAHQSLARADGKSPDGSRLVITAVDDAAAAAAAGLQDGSTTSPASAVAQSAPGARKPRRLGNRSRLGRVGSVRDRDRGVRPSSSSSSTTDAPMPSSTPPGAPAAAPPASTDAAQAPGGAIMVVGLFCAAAKWTAGVGLTDPVGGQDQEQSPLPPLRVCLEDAVPRTAAHVVCPMYRTTWRGWPHHGGPGEPALADVALLAGGVSPSHWVQRNVAVVCQPDNDE